MENNSGINICVKRTVENSVAGDAEFHFFVDELADDDSMPTYNGIADEKYQFEAMDDDFFDFLERKIRKNGIYIRLVHATRLDSAPDEAVFKLGYGSISETFKTSDTDSISDFEYADYGIKIRKAHSAFGAALQRQPDGAFYFAEFRSDDKFLSPENPFNQRILEIMETMIVLED